MTTDQLLALIQAEQKTSEDQLAHWQQQLQQAHEQIIARQVDLQRLAWLVKKINDATPEATDQTS